MNIYPESDSTPIRLRGDVTVELADSMASDNSVVYAARVSTGTGGGHSGIMDLDPKDVGLINMLMRDRHGSPFEHALFTFYIEAPIFTWREMMRHRIASYNEESARYKKLAPVFYVPNRDRKLTQVGTAGKYTFEFGDDSQHKLIETLMPSVVRVAYTAYEHMLDEGIAREVARMVLPLNIYSSAYVTMNARALMNFLSLRTTREGSSFPSFPQREIEMVAEKMEALFKQQMPATYDAFNKAGRVAP